MRVAFHPQAEVELMEVSLYYNDRDTRLGNEFIAEARTISSLLADQPRLGKPIDEIHRRFSLRRFPFFLIYRVDADSLHVVAVAHKRRRPGYWRTHAGR